MPEEKLYWLEFENGQANREWSLTDFMQPGTNLDTILNYSNIYIEWKKRLIQVCVNFEQVLPQIGDFFVDCKYLSAICKWTLFMCIMYYFIPQLRRRRERTCLERKKQPHGYAIQELRLYFKTPSPLFQNITAINAIQPISVWSTENFCTWSPQRCSTVVYKRVFFKLKP